MHAKSEISFSQLSNEKLGAICLDWIARCMLEENHDSNLGCQMLFENFEYCNDSDSSLFDRGFKH